MRKKLYLVLSNDDYEHVVYFDNKGSKIAKFLNTDVFYVSRCVIDKKLCKGYKIEVVDMSTDLKPNTYEDFIEFCKFEKIDPYRITSLLKYRKSIDEEIANAYLYGEI